MSGTPAPAPTPQGQFIFESPADRARLHPDPDALLAALAADGTDPWATRHADTHSPEAIRAQTITGLAARTDLTRDQAALLVPLVTHNAHATIGALMTNPAFTTHTDLVDDLLTDLDGDAAFGLSITLPAGETRWLPYLVLAVCNGLGDYATVVDDFWARYSPADIHAAVEALLGVGPAPLLPATAPRVSDEQPGQAMHVPARMDRRRSDALLTAPMSPHTRARLIDHLCDQALTDLDAALATTRPGHRAQARDRSALLMRTLADTAFDRYFRLLDRSDLTPADIQRLGDVLVVVDAHLDPMTTPENAYLPSSEFTRPEPLFETVAPLLIRLGRVSGNIPIAFWERFLSLPLLGNAAFRWRPTLGRLADRATPAAVAAHPVALLGDNTTQVRSAAWDDDTIATALHTLHHHRLLATAWTADHWRQAYRTLASAGTDGRLTTTGWQTLHDHLTHPGHGPATRYGWSDAEVAEILEPFRPLEYADRSQARRLHVYAAWAATTPNPHLRARAVVELWDIDQVPLVAADASHTVRLALLKTRFVTSTEATDTGRDATPEDITAHALIYRTLARDPSPEVRATIAARDHATPDALHRLATDSIDDIRALVAAHPNTTEADLRVMLDDPSPRVVQIVTDRYMAVLGTQA